MKKKQSISRYLDKHSYPAWFFRYSFMARAVYFLNAFLILRNWYVLAALRKQERKKRENKKDFCFLDAGSGMGEFVLGLARRNPESRGIGIDIIKENISVGNNVARAMNLKNAEFRHNSLTKLKERKKYDLILCNSTLQFIKEDKKALKNLFSAARQNGTLIIYIPVGYRRYLPWSGTLERRYLTDYFYRYHDDFLMHFYSESIILRNIKDEGFKIREIKYAYGICGIIAFELYSMLIVAVKEFNIVLSALCVFIYLPIFLPLQLILMTADYLIPKKSGNGILIVAEKK